MENFENNLNGIQETMGSLRDHVEGHFSPDEAFQGSWIALWYAYDEYLKAATYSDSFEEIKEAGRTFRESFNGFHYYYKEECEGSHADYRETTDPKYTFMAQLIDHLETLLSNLKSIVGV